MNNLKQLRENFNALVDIYESQDITIDTLQQAFSKSIKEANMLSAYVVYEVFEKKFNGLSNDDIIEIEGIIKDLLIAGSTIGQTGFLHLVVNGTLLKHLEKEQCIKKN